MTQLFHADTLTVRIYENRLQLGSDAAKMAGETLRTLLKQRDFVNIIFAAAPSQNEFLAALALEKDIEWRRVRAFHMDEYIDLPAGAPQRFGSFLKQSFFDAVPLAETYYLLVNEKDPQIECRHYAELLLRFPADVVFMGIGENTHIAFNDPHVAQFNDSGMVKIVDLDLACRQQQVNDGCFETLEQVPENALTLTVPALMKADYIFCMVPGKRKAEAVYHTLTDPVTERYPSTILRTHPGATLFIDKDSASLLR
jgi:glucosamine-6-phosphate deaminase